MLGIDERALKVIWTAFLFALLVLIVYYIRDTLFMFAVAIVFAYMLSPVIRVIERVIPRRRNLALAIVYCLFVGVLVLIGIQLVPEVATEATTLAGQVPKFNSDTPVTNIPLPGFLGKYRGPIESAINGQLVNLRSHVVPVLQSASSHLLSGLSALLPILLVPILAFFFLKDAELLRVNLIGAVDDRRDRTLMERIIDDVHSVLRSYIRALVLLSLTAFVAWISFLSIMRIHYPLLLAAAEALGEFIPVIGPTAALVIILIVCIITGSHGLLWVIVFWGLYRLFADYVLNPYLMSSGVEMHPLLVLFAVFAGGSIAGVKGMFFSIPIIAVVRVIFNNLRSAYMHRQLSMGVPTEVKVEVTAPVVKDPASDIVTP